MGVGNTIKEVGKGTLTAGKGTVKGMVTDGWKGLKAGLWTTLGVGVVTGIGLTALGVAAPIVVLGGLFASGLSFLPATTWGTSIGATWGGLFGGKRELEKSAQNKEQTLEVTRANEEHRLSTAQHQNMAIRSAISGQRAPQDMAPQQRAAQYQMHNHLAEGNAPNKFTSKFEAQQEAAKTQQVGGGVGK